MSSGVTSTRVAFSVYESAKFPSCVLSSPSTCVHSFSVLSDSIGAWSFEALVWIPFVPRRHSSVAPTLSGLQDTFAVASLMVPAQSTALLTAGVPSMPSDSLGV